MWLHHCKPLGREDGGGITVSAVLAVVIAGLPPVAPAIAQAPAASLPSPSPAVFPETIAQDSFDPPPLEEPRPTPPLPEPTPIPAPEEVLPVPPVPGVPEPIPEIEPPDTFVISEFSFVGNTVFDEATLQAIVADYTNRPITLNDLFAARTAITQTYVDAGYINSGAYLPTQRIENGVVEIRIIEGRLEAINITGLNRLDPAYIRSRIAIRTGQPLNVNSLVEALQLLQLDPLIEQLSAELAAGTTTGGSILNVTATEADVVTGLVILDNGRSPLVGSFRRRFVFSHGNLVGQGDRFTVGYSNTNGSNSWDFNYAYPINPHNGTLEVFYGGSRNRVITPEFEVLNIESTSDEVEFGLRQPIHQTPRQELALGIALDHTRQGSTFQLGDFPKQPFPSEGADGDGKTRITALRFRQEWTRRDANQVLAVRSQFSLGLNWFDATINDGATPDSTFLSWQFQSQYVRIFPDDIVLLLRLNGQLADRPLLSNEQFRLGGQGSVRGYQQDQATTDNGLFASVEARFPLLTIPEYYTSIQISPFVDYGWGWNSRGQDSTDFLSVGVGLIWQVGDSLNARLDYGIPLLEPFPNGDSLQEQGILFTITGEIF